MNRTCGDEEKFIQDLSRKTCVLSVNEKVTLKESLYGKKVWNIQKWYRIGANYWPFLNIKEKNFFTS
jgi:hypothetical protein